MGCDFCWNNKDETIRFQLFAPKGNSLELLEEVIEFTVYHFVKRKNEIAVKQELSKMGWKSDLEHVCSILFVLLNSCYYL